MKITFDLVVLISALGGIVAIWSALRKMLKEREAEKKADTEKEAKVLQMLDNDKKHLNKLDESVAEIKDHLKFQGDMTYAILKHMATNNATGEMQKALDDYNEHFRKNL